MQLVTMSRNGITYDLGYVMPLWSDNKQQFVIIPNFDFRPPFIVLRLERAYQRMEMLAVEHLAKGKSISQMQNRPNNMTLEPFKHIEAM